MFTIYRIKATNTASTYYGYLEESNQPRNILEQFLKQSHRSAAEIERGDKRLVEENGSEEGLSVDVLSMVENEWVALVERNQYRANDKQAVTGPSNWPLNMYKKAKEQCPDKVNQVENTVKAYRCKTARIAYAQGLFESAAIKQLPLTHDKATIVRDLDALSPRDFVQKYNVAITNKAA